MLALLRRYGALGLGVAAVVGALSAWAAGDAWVGGVAAGGIAVGVVLGAAEVAALNSSVQRRDAARRSRLSR